MNSFYKPNVSVCVCMCVTLAAMVDQRNSQETDAQLKKQTVHNITACVFVCVCTSMLWWV